MTVFRAPGRVNLIGDHTDYNEGFVLPAAIDLECVVDATPRRDDVVHVRSLGDEVTFRLDGAEVGEPAWGRYVAGIALALARRGRPAVGIDASVESTVPVGAGLSSSAAFEVSIGLALCDAARFELTPLELALACQEGDHLTVGVPSGIMDQLASVAGVADHALLIDCRSLEVEPIPIPQEVSIVVAHSGLPRTLVDSAYAERRAECERVAAALGLRSLRDATPEQVDDSPRARHVVSENARVLAAADALRRGDLAVLGPLMAASHASLRDDYEVSTPELDALVASLLAAGSVGARLTGAGFGGCAVALALREEAERVAAGAAGAYERETGLTPTTWICRAADGAGRMRA